MLFTGVAVRGFGETFENLSARATAARQANDTAAAITLYQQAVEANPRWQEGWWYLGSLLYDSDQYAAARDALGRLVALEPKAGPAWGLLGLSEFETGDYSAALTHIQRSLAPTEVKPAPQMEAVLRYHEALLLARAGDFDSAMQKYAGMIQSGAPPNPPLLAGIGVAALRMLLVPKEVPPDRQEVVARAGHAAYYTLARDFEKAGQSMQDLLQRFPSSPGVHYLYGCFLLANAPDHAIAELKRELDIAPSNAAAAAMIAWALLNRGDSAAALPYAQAAVKGAPALPTAQYALGRSLAETGDAKDGIEHLEEALKRDPANLETHLALASAYAEAGRMEEARRAREQAVAVAKGSAVAQR